MSNMMKSPWILHYNGAGCGGCNLEAMACFTPVYDAERFGIIRAEEPGNADILLITGAVNEKNRDTIIRIYEQMPEPKAVVAAGACACVGGIFADCYNVLGGIDEILSVDVYIAGCAARPENIIDGIIKGAEALEQKRRGVASRPAAPEAVEDDAPEAVEDDTPEIGDDAPEDERMEENENAEEVEEAEGAEETEDSESKADDVNDSESDSDDEEDEAEAGEDAAEEIDEAEDEEDAAEEIDEAEDEDAEAEEKDEEAEADEGEEQDEADEADEAEENDEEGEESK